MIDPRAYSMPEDRGSRSLAANVQEIMDDLGLWGYHPYDSRRSQPGWPDWVILGPRGALFRELKAEGRQLTPEQRSVGARLISSGLNWAVWRPRDLFNGVIPAQMLAIAAHTKEAA